MTRSTIAPGSPARFAVGVADRDLRDIIADQLARLNEHDIDGFVQFCHPEVVFVSAGANLFGGVHRGTEQIRRFFGILFQIVEDLHFDVRHILVLGDCAAIEWKNHGHTFRGDLYENQGVTVMEFRDGQLVKMREHLDTEKLAAFGSSGSRKARS